MRLGHRELAVREQVRRELVRNGNPRPSWLDIDRALQPKLGPDYRTRSLQSRFVELPDGRTGSVLSDNPFYLVVKVYVFASDGRPGGVELVKRRSVTLPRGRA